MFWGRQPSKPRANEVAGAGHVKSEIEIAAKENSKKTGKCPSNN